jgi:abortive infection bacteriophage resistance protein
MAPDKEFLTYNQQMKKLRSNKKIECENTRDKTILVRMGYFNLINGYKEPFICGKDIEGNHIYIPNTSLNAIYSLKKFDDGLRILLLKYITQIEEEVRTLTGYKFDQCNDNGKIPWYDAKAYSDKSKLQNKMNAISSAYSELNRSRSEYVQFYMNNHETIPTWIMIKVVNFSTFIDILGNSKNKVTHALCELYDLKDGDGYYNVKLLIGSLHWMRKVRNSCAHNERVYCIKQIPVKNDKNSGRIIERYFRSMRTTYLRDKDKNIMDLFVYFKYYLTDKDFKDIIEEFQKMLLKLQSEVSVNAFDNVRGKMGIKNLEDLELLKNMPKTKIMYHKFDTY